MWVGSGHPNEDNTLDGTESTPFFDFDITLQLNETANASLPSAPDERCRPWRQEQRGLGKHLRDPPNTIIYNAGSCILPP